MIAQLVKGLPFGKVLACSEFADTCHGVLNHFLVHNSFNIHFFLAQVRNLVLGFVFLLGEKMFYMPQGVTYGNVS